MRFKQIIALLLSKPDFFIEKAGKAAVRRVKKLALLVNRVLGARGASIPPQEVSFCITRRCNLRCKMCGQWGKSGISKNAQPGNPPDELSLPQLQKVVAEVSGFNPVISIWGGEPLLRPDLFQFIHFVKSKNLFCNVISNGIFLEKQAEAMVQSGLDTLSVSLDGPEAGHDAIRGAGAFRKSVRGIQTMQKIKKQLATHKPYLHIGTVIVEENYRGLEEMLDIARELEAESLSLVHAWSIKEENGLKYEKLLKEHLGCSSAQSWRGFLDAGNTIDTAELSAIEEKIRRKSQSIPNCIVKFYPDVPAGDIPRYYRDPGFSLAKRSCNAPWYKADVRPNGDVTFCTDYPDYLIGNVKDSPFMEIWNNARARAFRKLIRKKGMFPICPRCCELYIY